MNSPILNGQLAADVLRATTKPTTVFDKDSHLAIRPSDHELVIHSTDNARVAWADIVLGKDAFESVSWEATETGLDFNRVAAITDKVMGRSPTSVMIDESNEEFSLTAAGVTLSKSQVVPSYVPRVIDPPEHERPAEAILSGGALDQVITLADDLTDYLRLGVDSNENTVYACAEGDDDSVRLVLEQGDMAGLQTADVESVFPLTYLRDIQNVLSDDTNIRLALGDMIPAVIQYPIAGGNGSVRFTLRPMLRAL